MKNGIRCVTACGGCHGLGCANEREIDAEDDEYEDDDADDGNLFERLF